MSNFKLDWNGEEMKRTVLSVCKKNVKTSAENVATKARHNVPVDNGDLKESIGVKTWSKKGVEGAYVHAGEKGAEHIAAFVELGTPGSVYTGGAYKGQKRTPIAAKPYLRPALKREKSKFKKSFNGAL